MSRYVVPDPQLYTGDADVSAAVTALMPLLTVYLCLDAVQLVQQGVLRGAGAQSVGVIASLCSFLLAVVPAAALLGLLTPLGQRGLWLGTVAGYSVMVTAFATLLWRMNWTDAASNAVRLASCSSDPEADEAGVAKGSHCIPQAATDADSDALETGSEAVEVNTPRADHQQPGFVDEVESETGRLIP